MGSELMINDMRQIWRIDLQWQRESGGKSRSDGW
jgi:hypothetical protein